MLVVEKTEQSALQWMKAGLGVGLATMVSPYLGLGVGIVVGIRTLASFAQDVEMVLAWWTHVYFGCESNIVVVSFTTRCLECDH